ncbi:hypothetical protein EYR40_009974 [Pleurotus pulmonarius]|nr:hypothetical protein EYR36_010633 [Pleurotus pulmonarius]KAF4588423.1 hypothetical protein EYR40_009974 [Pleurotus pulmonarius]KAF4590540.1 hypothetical protein EYR38_009841 [Pleurotus pulmonarius]
MSGSIRDSNGKPDSICLARREWITYEEAREFIEWYCGHFKLDGPQLCSSELPHSPGTISAALIVGGYRLSNGKGNTRDAAERECYLLAAQHVECHDHKAFVLFVKKLLDDTVVVVDQVEPSSGYKSPTSWRFGSRTSAVTYDQARAFMKYYCTRFGFGKPTVTYTQLAGLQWEAVMIVDDRRIGIGKGLDRQASRIACYLDTTRYLRKCDPDLWKVYVRNA